MTCYLPSYRMEVHGYSEEQVKYYMDIINGITNAGKKDNAAPLFDWGKYVERDGRLIMPVSVQAHHSFVDGLHVGRFVERLQKFVREYGV